MAYIVAYDYLYDEVFQCLVDTTTADKAREAGAEVHEEPVEGVPVQSRYRSKRHKQWATSQNSDEE